MCAVYGPDGLPGGRREAARRGRHRSPSAITGIDHGVRRRVERRGPPPGRGPAPRGAERRARAGP